MELKKIVEKTLAYFEITKRGEDTIVILKDNTPEALRDSVRKAHGEKLPDDWIYDKYHSVLDALTQYNFESTDDLEEKRPEIVDSLVDMYTRDLTKWLNDSPYNVYYITEAQEEYGVQEDGFKILQMAQYKAIDEIAGEVIGYLTQEAEEEERERDQEDLEDLEAEVKEAEKPETEKGGAE